MATAIKLRALSVVNVFILCPMFATFLKCSAHMSANCRSFLFITVKEGNLSSHFGPKSCAATPRKVITYNNSCNSCQIYCVCLTRGLLHISPFYTSRASWLHWWFLKAAQTCFPTNSFPQTFFLNHVYQSASCSHRVSYGCRQLISLHVSIENYPTQSIFGEEGGRVCNSGSLAVKWYFRLHVLPW